MSSASLAVAARPHPEAARVVALSAAIALNLAALLILTRPLAPQVLALMHKLAAVPQVTFIEPPPKVPPPPAIELKPLPHPPAAPVHVQPRPDVAPPVATPSVEGTQPMPTVAPPSATPADTTTPVEATLAYRSAPLQFPAQALRQHLQGTVLLRVLVDENGAPVQVEVEHGSGYAVLDRSAREQVLAHWRFQPAMVNGHAVRAWARVPVSFVLHDL
ncbi:energy transducer TonB [Rhodanobacter sp. C06]|uniref:TonB family protein n=1 Tax=Rhodanobacter sp. C06 TaxID=1945854 RepID=UPI000986F0A9|nr:TonB family protein [Rhodanobacter sp. C06]OOG50337.1 energy transducer TonB [Rhodanobacter sp. C06]